MAHREIARDHARCGPGKEGPKMPPHRMAPESRHRHQIGADQDQQDQAHRFFGRQDQGEKGHRQNADAGHAGFGKPDQEGAASQKRPLPGLKFGPSGEAQ